METEFTEAIDIMNLLEDGFKVKMPFQKLEYFRTKKVALKDDNGSYLKVKETELNKRTKGHKKGVFLAFVDPIDEKVVVGFSMCHKYDRFDYRQGLRINGLGAWYAMNRADKYKESTEFVIGTDCSHKQLPKEIVKIPQSMLQDLTKFIFRCKKYYKDKTLPVWAENLVS